MRITAWVYAVFSACFMTALVVASPTAARAEDPISLDFTPVFDGMPASGAFPLTVQLRNRGPSVDGAVVVSVNNYMGAGRRYRYPLSLPTGTIKRLIAYPLLPDYGGTVTVSFGGPGVDEVSADLKLPGYQGVSGTPVGLIGDAIGGLASLRMVVPSRPSGPVPSYEPSMVDCYARPEDAPDRAAGYASFRALFVSDGAERLSPAQWAAIRRWVLGGGRLVLLGGAGAVYLKSPDAQPLLPVLPSRSAVVRNLRLPGVAPGNIPSGEVAVRSGPLPPGAGALARQDGMVTLAVRPFGLGAVIYAAFNPLEKPFRGAAGQGEVWKGLIEATSRSARSGILWRVTYNPEIASMFLGPASYAGYGPYGPYGPSSYPGPIQTSGATVNPFQVNLPSALTVTWVLLAYFVLVVPVSYLVLKRLRRLEWAWVTSPLLAIGFAFVFYLFAARLYGVGMSRRTTGIIAMDAGSPDGCFIGRTELFFPHGGRYAVEPPNAESLEMGSYGNDPFTASRTDPLLTVDRGIMAAPGVRVTNLAFRQVAHSEPVTLNGSVTGVIRWRAGGGIGGTIHNGTDRDLRDAYVGVPGAGVYAPVGDIGAGRTVEVRNVRHLSQPSGSPTGPSPRRPGALVIPPQAHSYMENPRIAGRSRLLMAMLWTDRKPDRLPTGAVLLGGTDGSAFGPQIGRDVGGDRSVDVLVSLPLVGGSR